MQWREASRSFRRAVRARQRSAADCTTAARMLTLHRPPPPAPRRCRPPSAGPLGRPLPRAFRVGDARGGVGVCVRMRRQPGGVGGLRRLRPWRGCDAGGGDGGGRAHGRHAVPTARRVGCAWAAAIGLSVGNSRRCSSLGCASFRRWDVLHVAAMRVSSCVRVYACIRVRGACVCACVCLRVCVCVCM